MAADQMPFCSLFQNREYRLAVLLKVVKGNSLNLNNADKHVWSCSILAGFSNKRMMNKINEFDSFDLLREGEWRKNHTEKYNRNNRTPQNFNWLRQKCF